MEVWAHDDTDRTALADTYPPNSAAGPIDDLRRLVPKVAERARSVADALRVLDGRAEEANLAIARDVATHAHHERMQAARSAADSAFASLGEALVELGSEMAACGQDESLYELDQHPTWTARDAWRLRLGVYDRLLPNEFERFPKPLADMARSYESLAASLANYARDLESPLEAP